MLEDVADTPGSVDREIGDVASHVQARTASECLLNCVSCVAKIRTCEEYAMAGRAFKHHPIRDL